MSYFGTDDIEIYNLSALLTIDTIINQIINILTNYLIKSSNFAKSFLRKFVSFLLIYCKMYVILADIGNDDKQMWFCHQFYDSS